MKQFLTTLLITVILISLELCAPTFAKSLAPIWLPNDPSNNNNRYSSGFRNEKPSDTTAHPQTKSDAPIIRHVSSLPSKKDRYLGREWSTGNLPFSILYVNTQRASHSDSNKLKNIKRPVDTGITPKPQANRSTIRNRGVGQARRQYSIIPELFMSYGWGRLGQ